MPIDPPVSIYPASSQEAAFADVDGRLREYEARIAALEAGNTDPPPEPPDPIVDPSGFVYGYSHTNRARLETDTGVLVNADRIYESGLPSSWGATKASSFPARYLPLLSVKGSITSVPTAAYRSLVESIPRPVILIYRHEPENDNANPDDFVEAQGILSEVLADVGNSNVHMALNLMRSWADKSAADGGSIAYVPDPANLAVPCGLTWDGYQREGTADQGPEQLFASALDITQDSGLAWWGILETASETEAASWVGDVTAWAQDNGAKGVMYWPSKVDDPNEPNFYPPSSAFDEFAAVALHYGGTPA